MKGLELNYLDTVYRVGYAIMSVSPVTPSFPFPLLTCLFIQDYSLSNHSYQSPTELLVARPGTSLGANDRFVAVSP